MSIMPGCRSRPREGETTAPPRFHPHSSRGPIGPGAHWGPIRSGAAIWRRARRLEYRCAVTRTGRFVVFRPPLDAILGTCLVGRLRLPLEPPAIAVCSRVARRPLRSSRGDASVLPAFEQPRPSLASSRSCHLDSQAVVPTASGRCPSRRGREYDSRCSRAAVGETDLRSS